MDSQFVTQDFQKLKQYALKCIVFTTFEVNKDLLTLKAIKLKQISLHKWLIISILTSVGVLFGYGIQVMFSHNFNKIDRSEIVTTEYTNTTEPSEHIMHSQISNNSSVFNKYNLKISLIYIISIFLVLSISYILYKLHLQAVTEAKDVDKEFYLTKIELIQNQLDPHFLFNALNSISYSIHSSDKKTAYSNLGLFSKFLRGSIGSLDECSRSLEEELEYVKNYLTLEKFRFKEKFDYNLIISPDVSKSTIIPKLILFSFIESALKKGVLPKDIGGRIDITIDSYDDKGLYMGILDTGLHRNIENGAASHTTNMLLTNRIVTYFNNRNTTKISITMKDIGTYNNPKGSKVEVLIPLGYQCAT